jgi:hypothetical protein
MAMPLGEWRQSATAHAQRVEPATLLRRDDRRRLRRGDASTSRRELKVDVRMSDPFRARREAGPFVVKSPAGRARAETCFNSQAARCDSTNVAWPAAQVANLHKMGRRQGAK